MLIDEELTLKKLEVFLAFMRSGNLTRAAIELGWRPPDAPGMFDLLPITICDARGRRRLYELPVGTIKEVRIEHPSCARFAEPLRLLVGEHGEIGGRVDAVLGDGDLHRDGSSPRSQNVSA